MKTIYVRIKNTYGTDLVYPACDTSFMLSALVGTKTFTDRQIQLIKALGYELKTREESI